MNRNSPIPLWVVLTIGVALLAGVYVFAQRTVVPPQASVIVKRLTATPQGSASSTRAGIPQGTGNAVLPATSTIDLQNSCRNERRRFQLIYPSTWKMYSPGPPEARPVSCNEVGDIMFWGPDIYGDVDPPRLTLYIYDKTNKQDTLYQQAETLSEFLRLNPERSKHLVNQTVTRDGATIIWFDDGVLVSFADHVFFEFRSYKIDPRLLIEIMQNLEFLK
jgi:hypothetical protein